jgi:hypothetical protein
LQYLDSNLDLVTADGTIAWSMVICRALPKRVAGSMSTAADRAGDNGACPERRRFGACRIPRMTRGVATVVLKAAWLR